MVPSTDETVFRCSKDRVEQFFTIFQLFGQLQNGWSCSVIGQIYWAPFTINFLQSVTLRNVYSCFCAAINSSNSGLKCLDVSFFRFLEEHYR
jgi:hypothetical protein